MQIVLIGAPSTGKTSVIKNLPDKYKQYCIYEVIRNLTSQDPSILHSQNSNDFSQDRFFYEYIYLFSKYPDYISDRGMLDVCAYTRWLMSRGQCSQTTYEKQMYILKEWLATHPETIHVYFPIYFPAKEDGYRDTDENNRQEVDLHIQEVIDELIKDGLWRGFKIDDLPVVERVQDMIKIIESVDK